MVYSNEWPSNLNIYGLAMGKCHSSIPRPILPMNTPEDAPHKSFLCKGGGVVPKIIFLPLIIFTDNDWLRGFRVCKYRLTLQLRLSSIEASHIILIIFPILTHHNEPDCLCFQVWSKWCANSRVKFFLLSNGRNRYANKTFTVELAHHLPYTSSRWTATISPKRNLFLKFFFIQVKQ